jgi:hypothetical protein
VAALPPPDGDLSRVPEKRLAEEALECGPGEDWCDGDSSGLLYTGVACVDDDLSPSSRELYGLTT